MKETTEDKLLANEQDIENFHETSSLKEGFDIPTVLLAGTGFMIDAYDIFVISILLPLIYQTYYPSETRPYISTFASDYPLIDGLLKVCTHVGNIIGQIGFGIAGDVFGRNKVYGIEMMIVLVSTIGCTLAASSVRTFSILPVLGFWRVLMGIGMGGDYPQSATITAERAGPKYRGMMVSAVFSMQGIGILLGSIVTITTMLFLRDDIIKDFYTLDYVWRIVLLFSIIPSAIVLYFRLTLKESKAYTRIKRADSNDTCHKIINFREWISDKRNSIRLFSCAYCWFALDIAWYGLSLNQPLILSLIGFGGHDGYRSAFDKYYELALGGLIISLLGTVPGYWMTVALIEKMGRKYIQCLGFIVIGTCLTILALFWNIIKESAALFIFVFTISQFFFNFGPNVTTFVIPSELFPTRFRSRCHGISAASGKVGAIVGVALVNPYFEHHPSLVLALYALIMFSGFFVTLLLPETKGEFIDEYDQ
ncbi:phosphate transporter [Boothiomyces sp. JEL0838]|nr:phosphate transporter [Boothiomyces sp. JEL0838]